jgi:hypothetical protein
VWIFTFSFVVAQVMTRGKRPLNRNFVHPAPFTGRI